jgi:hypothetical protein
LLPRNCDIDTKDPINKPIDTIEKSTINQVPPLKALETIALVSAVRPVVTLAAVVCPLILLLSRNIYEVFDCLLNIFLTAAAGKDIGPVPKDTIISTSTNNSICPPIIKIKLDFEKSYN